MTSLIDRSRPRSYVAWALLAAASLEALMLAGAAGYLGREHPADPAPFQPIQLELVAPPAPALPKPPEPAPEKPLAPTPDPPKAELPKVEPKPHPIIHAAPAKPLAPPTLSPNGPVSDAPSDFATSPAVAAAASAPAPEAKATATDLFQAQLRAAVQAAVRYPNAARILKFTGQTKLGFDYRDGRISNPAIVRSSGTEMLDQAALDALQRAAFPLPPKDLAGQSLGLQVTVLFSVQ